MMLEMVRDRTARGVARAARTAVVLRRGKLMEKLLHYYFSWLAPFQKREDTGN